MQQEKETHGAEKLWRNTVYTYARLLYDPRTQNTLAPLLLPFVVQIEEARNGQWDCWKATLFAHARVEGTDVRLDGAVNRHGATCQFLKTTGGKGKDRYDIFYRDTSPAKVTAMRLEKELKHTAPWLPLLESDSIAEIQAFHKEFAELHQEGKVALDERATSQNNVRAHRTRSIGPLVESLNKTRKKIHLALQQISNDEDIPLSWVESFFRKQKQAGTDDPLERRREAILTNLVANEVDIYDEFVQRLDETEDEAILKTWTLKAAAATSMESFLIDLGITLERRKK